MKTLKHIEITFWTTVLAAALWATSGNATIILQDDFSKGTGGGTSAGTVVDNTKWATNPATVPLSWFAVIGGPTITPSTIDGSGQANVNPNTTEALASLTSLDAAPTAVHAGELKLTVTLANDFPSFGVFGLADGLGHRILMNTSISANLFKLQIVGDNNHSSLYDFPSHTGLTTVGSAGTWLFDWTPTKITLFKNGLLQFDSSVNNPDEGFPTWDIPSAATAMGPAVFRTLPGSYPATALVDFISFQDPVIPEPSTILLFGLGGALVRWRRNRD